MAVYSRAFSYGRARDHVAHLKIVLWSIAYTIYELVYIGWLEMTLIAFYGMLFVRERLVSVIAILCAFRFW